jgi:predicted ATPase
VGKKTNSQLTSRRAFRANLPIPLTSFIGRERELAEVTDLLARTRLLTLMGAGGCGKTRLALQLAKDTADAFPDGVWAVELAPVSDPVLLPQSVALALGVQDAPRQPLTETLSNYLRRKHLLLVLDNCERLRTAIAQLAQTLLMAAPDLKILATSREALSVAGEATYLVPSLSLPKPLDQSRAPTDSQSELQRYDAPTLFIERAKAVSSNFSVTQQNASAIERVCQRLDGVPLAIELAAARARVLTVEQIAVRLDDRFNLLTSDNPTTVIPRHQTLRAAIDWSYDYLSEQEQKMFCRLAVFAGGFTIEAAEAICSHEELAPQQVLGVITELVDKSMLAADTAGRVETRYRVLETMREYAREKLMASSEWEAAHARHLDYFVQLAEAAEPKLRSAVQLACLKRLEAEHDNLRAALQWSLASANSQAALRLAGAAFWFWFLHGDWSECQKWLDEALALGERERSRRVDATGGDEAPSHAELAQRAKALYGAGLIRFARTFEIGVVRSKIEESLRLWRTLEDNWWIAVVLKDAGQLNMMEGDIYTARAQLEEGVALARGVEDQWALAVCLAKLGLILGRVDLAAARLYLQEAVAVSRAIGDKSILIYALVNLGAIYFFQGDIGATAPLAEEALAAARALGSKLDMFFGLFAMGLLNIVQGDPAKATAYLMELLSLARETGSTAAFLYVLLGFGAMAVVGGQPRRAARLLGAWATVAQMVGLNTAVDSGPTVAIYKTFLQSTQAQLDEATFNAALAEGQALTLEQAIEEAQSVAAQVQNKPDSPASEIEIKPRADLTLIAFGPAQIYRGAGLLTSADWTYAKARELLFYLLSHAAQTKDQIGVDLWPDVSPPQLRNTLGVRLHHLRRALGRPDWIVFENNAYAFNRSLNYWFDVRRSRPVLRTRDGCKAILPSRPLDTFKKPSNSIAATFCRTGWKVNGA